MTDSGSGVGAAIVGTVLVCALLVAAAGGTAAATAAGAETGIERPALQANDTADDRDGGGESEPERPVRHANPDEYAEESDLETLEAWLTGRLVDALETATETAGRGEYDAAEGAIGGSFDGRLDQYDDVASETSGASHDSLFADARNDQARVVESHRTFDETVSAYEDARQAGDERRARTLALEIDELAVEIDNSTASLLEHYDELEDALGVDLSTSAATLTELAREVEERRDGIRSTEFTETAVTLEREREGEPISYREPLRAGGRVTTADGDPVANEALRLEIGADTVRTETDSDGRFDLEYRPTTVPATATTLEVRYAPEPPAPYLGSETRVDVAIEQVTPEVTALEAPAETAYGEDIPVSGELSVDGVPVDGLDLEVILDGKLIGNLTVREGAFDGVTTVPADVPAGERELGVRLPDGDRAVAGVDERTVVTVRETDTELRVDASADGDGSVRATGTLATADGDGVEGQSVTLLVDGEPRGNATTAADGTFEGTVAAPTETADDVTVTAAFDGTGTNLASAQAGSAVRAAAASGGASSFPLSTGALVVGALGLFGVGLFAIRYRRRSRSIDRSPTRVVDRTETREVHGEEREPAADPAIARAHLDAAVDGLSNGRPDAAVVHGYEAVRRELTARVDGDEALTHWEFYRRYRRRTNDDAPNGDDGTDDPTGTVDALCDLTERYERAAFTRDGLTEHEAASALELARTICDRNETDRRATSAVSE